MAASILAEFLCSAEEAKSRYYDSVASVEDAASRLVRSDRRWFYASNFIELLLVNDV